MRILLLTGGDATAADTSLLETILSVPGREGHMRSSADFFPVRLLGFSKQRLRWLVKHPKICSHQRGSPSRFFSRSARELRLYLEQEEFDLIVCREVFPALLLTEALFQHPTETMTCLVTTGSECRPGTEYCAMDRFILSGGHLIPDFLDRGIPEEKLVCNQSLNGA